MKNIATQPRNNVVSHQCMTSTFANVRPLISVVTPFTSSWCAWWLYDRSNGDLRSLIVSTNMSAKNVGMHTTIIGRPMFATPATSKVPRAKNMHTATKSTVGSYAMTCSVSRSAPTSEYGEREEYAATMKNSAESVMRKTHIKKLPPATNTPPPITVSTSAKVM